MLAAVAVNSSVEARALRPGSRSLGLSAYLSVRLMAAAYALVFGVAAVLDYVGFRSAGYDLGNNVQAIWNTAHGRLLRDRVPRLPGHAVECARPEPGLPPRQPRPAAAPLRPLVAGRGALGAVRGRRAPGGGLERAAPARRRLPRPLVRDHAEAAPIRRGDARGRAGGHHRRFRLRRSALQHVRIEPVRG